MRLEHVDVGEGAILDAGDGTTVMDQLSNIVATSPHPGEPRPRNRTQIRHPLAEPGVDGGVALRGAWEPKKFVHCHRLRFPVIRQAHQPSTGASPFCPQDLAACFNRTGSDQDEGDEARLRPVVDPVVDRAALNDDIAGPEVHDYLIVELHVDLT